MKRLPIFRVESPGIPVYCHARSRVRLPGEPRAAEAATLSRFSRAVDGPGFCRGAPAIFLQLRRSVLVGNARQMETQRAAASTRRLPLARTITFTDPETGLEVRVEAAIYLDTPSVEWTLYFTNRGKRTTPILEQLQTRST